MAEHIIAKLLLTVHFVQIAGVLSVKLAQENAS